MTRKEFARMNRQMTSHKITRPLTASEQDFKDAVAKSDPYDRRDAVAAMRAAILAELENEK